MKDYRGNFEVHITVEVSGSHAPLHEWCVANDCKCVFIVLARGTHPQQPMVSWRRGTVTLPAVLQEANSRAQELQQSGFLPIRLKIEADPDNEGIPLSDEDASNEPLGNYFEHHIKLRRQITADHGNLLTLCLDHGAHLSRNAFRITAGGIEERFVTLRSHGIGCCQSHRRLEELRSSLEAAGEHIVEVESEYAVYDSNIALDDGWLRSASR
ncbi:MAG: hypothetical protein U0996_00650 [Planctomycetaceae bacterium]